MPDPESSPRFRALINYRTPAGGQGSRKRRIASAWSAVQSFLRDCAEVEPIDHATLALFDADEYTPDYDPRPLLEASVPRSSGSSARAASFGGRFRRRESTQ